MMQSVGRPSRSTVPRRRREAPPCMQWTFRACFSASLRTCRSARMSISGAISPAEKLLESWTRRATSVAPGAQAPPALRQLGALDALGRPLALVARDGAQHLGLGVLFLQARVLPLVDQAFEEQRLQAHDHGLGEVTRPLVLRRPGGHRGLQRLVLDEGQHAAVLDLALAGLQRAPVQADLADVQDGGRPGILEAERQVVDRANVDRKST